MTEEQQRVYNAGMGVAEASRHSHVAPLNVPKNLATLNEDFTPAQIEEAKKLANEAAHSRKPPLHNPKAENKP